MTLYLKFAYTRVTLIDKLEENLAGALYHHYLLALLRQMGVIRFRDHWTTEHVTYLGLALRAMRHSATIGNDGKYKAYLAVKARLQRQDLAVRSDAVDHFVDIFKVAVKKLKLHDQNTELFWKRIDTRMKGILVLDGWREY